MGDGLKRARAAANATRKKFDDAEELRAAWERLKAEESEARVQWDTLRAMDAAVDKVCASPAQTPPRYACTVHLVAVDGHEHERPEPPEPGAVALTQRFSERLSNLTGTRMETLVYLHVWWQLPLVTVVGCPG